jgi:hypothetical protein
MVGGCLGLNMCEGEQDHRADEYQEQAGPERRSDAGSVARFEHGHFRIGRIEIDAHLLAGWIAGNDRLGTAADRSRRKRGRRANIFP